MQSTSISNGHGHAGTQTKIRAGGRRTLRRRTAGVSHRPRSQSKSVRARSILGLDPWVGPAQGIDSMISKKRSPFQSFQSFIASLRSGRLEETSSKIQYSGNFSKVGAGCWRDGLGTWPGDPTEQCCGLQSYKTNFHLSAIPKTWKRTAATCRRGKGDANLFDGFTNPI